MKRKLIIAGLLGMAGFTNLTAQNWLLLGNTGTVDGTHFIGTTDNVPLNFRVGQPSGRIDLNLNHTSFGYASLYSNTGTNNSAFGFLSLYYNWAGIGNTAFGAYTLFNNSNGNWNTAAGYKSLYLSVGDDNTALGARSLEANTSGNYNTASGFTSMNLNSSGSGNTAWGADALFSGNSSYNTAMGYFSLFQGGVGYCTGLGTFSDLGTSSLSNAMALGYGAIANASNKCRIGNASMGITECQLGVYTVSDGRFKNKISESDVKGLAFIKLLRPAVYNFDTRDFTEFLTKNMPDSLKKNYMYQNFDVSSAARQTGFIAQEAEKAAQQAGFDFNGIHAPVDENDNYSVNYSQFVVPLVKGMQEQQPLIEEQQKELADLLKRMEVLEAKAAAGE